MGLARLSQDHGGSGDNVYLHADESEISGSQWERGQSRLHGPEVRPKTAPCFGKDRSEGEKKKLLFAWIVP